jgi:nucleolar protein 56
VHDVLKNFLELNLPAGKKKSKVELGVTDEKLGGAINDSLEQVACVKSKTVAELTRGIRLHFSKFIKAFKEGDYEKAQLGLGHSYSRSKVKFNVNRADNMIIQTINLLDTLNKDLNTFSMRVKYVPPPPLPPRWEEPLRIATARANPLHVCVVTQGVVLVALPGAGQGGVRQLPVRARGQVPQEQV